MKRISALACGAALALLQGASVGADVRLPKVFGDHMVMQRQMPLPVWGWADPGEKVEVSFAGETARTTANEAGEWKVQLPPMEAGGPHRLRVSGKNAVERHDVLVGEVWLCSGQSNMEMGVKLCLLPEKKIAAADHPRLRLFLVPRTFSPTPQEDVDAAWAPCTPESVAEGGWGGFSAAAYHFGRYLQAELDVPVGLVQAAWGGTRIEPWTPPAGFAASKDEAVRAIYRQVRLRDPGSDEHRARLSALLDEVEAWLGDARDALRQAVSVAPMPEFLAELLPADNVQQPTVLYNGMIHPLAPFAMRGAIWYQGESNHREGSLYTAKTKALVEGWRGLWKSGDFPFYFVQIAPFPYGEEAADVLPRLWEAQAAALKIPHTGMAVIHDVGDTADIHPKNKEEVGRRLALWALAKTYGREESAYSGPLFRDFEVERGRVRVRWAHADGLRTRDGETPDWFELIDRDRGGFVKAEARIEGDNVVLQAAGVPHPVGVRYAWHKLASPNLVNAAGLPAAPFRAGEEPHRDRLETQVPEAGGYSLVYDLDLGGLGAEIAYATDRSQVVDIAFDRIAYFVELEHKDGEARFVYVSMDAFTDDRTKIGVPTLGSGAHFQQAVHNLKVWSNTGLGRGIELDEGFIEFWPNNYTPQNSAGVEGASAQRYDFGDMPVEPVDGYGSMQVHDAGNGRTLFAVNHWRAGEKADIGIGNSTGDHSDWTFTGNANGYAAKRLRVLVREKK